MKEVRVGVIGVGGMGTSHARALENGNVKRARLVAICDTDPKQFEKFDDGPLRFEDSAELIRSGEVDAVLIATPHYSHTTIGIDALSNGLHTLVEKPLSVHKADCQRLIAAHTDPKLKFAAMFNQRTDPRYKKVRELIENGEMGELSRTNWIITNWFRSQAYYDSGGWRATWAGEGGGVLLNQSPHQLDLFQWICGMPVRVRAFCGLGKRHHIEVEDEVTAYVEYDNGATGVFITSTGEAPGTNRFEICGERGKIVLEGGKLSWTRNEVEQTEHLKTSPDGFRPPSIWEVEIPTKGSGGQHIEVFQNFIDAILDDVPLIAPAAEGIRSVELGNAMLLSSLTGRTIELPMDAAEFEAELQGLIKNSTFTKTVGADVAGVEVDLSNTFGVE